MAGRQAEAQSSLWTATAIREPIMEEKIAYFFGLRLKHSGIGSCSPFPLAKAIRRRQARLQSGPLPGLGKRKPRERGAPAPARAGAPAPPADRRGQVAGGLRAREASEHGNVRSRRAHYEGGQRRADADEDALAEAEALGEPVRWERHVQAYVLGGELLVRLPGVRVLEQHPTDLDEEGVAVHRIYGHRPSGTVLVTAVDCYGEDCTCDPGTSSTILRWSPDTLATIDDRPCGAGDGPDPTADEHCELSSGFVEDVDPWAI